MLAKNNISQKEKILYVLVVIAALFYLIEGAVPRPLPWMKLGLANIITILVIYYFDFSFLIKFIFLRIISGSLITATLFTPSFFLSFTGSICSGIGMYLIFKIFKKNISPIGLSVAGASLHLVTQTFVVYFFIIHDTTILYALPLILITAIITGTITGYISYKVINELELYNFKGKLYGV